MAIKYALAVKMGPPEHIKLLTKKKIHILRTTWKYALTFCDLVFDEDSNLIISPSLMRTGLFFPENMCRVCLRSYLLRWPVTNVQIPKIYRDLIK